MRSELVLSVGGESSPEAIEQLRLDLNESVGPTNFQAGAANEGSKGPGVIEIGTLLVTVLSAPAMLALVQTLRSYLERNKMTKISVKGPGGAVELELPAGTRLDEVEIQSAINKVLTEVP